MYEFIPGIFFVPSVFVLFCISYKSSNRKQTNAFQANWLLILPEISAVLIRFSFEVSTGGLRSRCAFLVFF